MRSDDKPVFAAHLTNLLATYGRGVTVGVIDVWWGVLEPFELGDVSRAFSRYVGDPDQGRYPPVPASIVAQLRPGAKAQSLRAFDVVVKAMAEVGPYRSVVFDDPLIHAVVEDLGGWPHINATWTLEELKFRSQEFCTRYEGYVVDPPAVVQRTLRGLETVPSVVLIGDPQRAAAVMNGPVGDRLRVTRPGGMTKVRNLLSGRSEAEPDGGA
jgi:hypothetical protein